jgi:curved DNA-binding protein CbpA
MSAVTTGDRALSRLLAVKAASDSSGVLHATRGKLKRLFCIDHGWLVYGASNLIEEQLDEYLVRQGALAPAERAAASAEAARVKQDTVSYLLAAETLSLVAARRGMEGLLKTLLTSCLEWPDGEFDYSAGRPDLTGKVTVRLDPVQLILQHARRYPVSLDAVRIRLGPPDARPVRSTRGDGMLESATTADATRYLLENTDGNHTLGELLADCPASEEETLRSLYGLLLVGAIEERAARRARPGAKDSPLTEEECIAVLGRVTGADHYGILGLERRALREEIRDAYYSLARRYHPDRFRAGDLHRYLSQMEAYFTKVTEAYNTLYSPELRPDYDRHLDERVHAPVEEKGTAHLARQNFLRAKELLERRRLAEAASYLENAIRQDESVAEYHLELGALLAGNPRRRADAEGALWRAIEIDPSLIRAYVALGDLYQKAARPADAARMFREALNWDPTDDHVKQRLGALGNVGEASEGLLRRLLR